MPDQIQRFMFDHTNVRGEIVTLAAATTKCWIAMPTHRR